MCLCALVNSCSRSFIEKTYTACVESRKPRTNEVIECLNFLRCTDTRGFHLTVLWLPSPRHPWLPCGLIDLTFSSDAFSMSFASAMRTLFFLPVFVGFFFPSFIVVRYLAMRMCPNSASVSVCSGLVSPCRFATKTTLLLLPLAGITVYKPVPSDERSNAAGLQRRVYLCVRATNAKEWPTARRRRHVRWRSCRP